jgi:hypothetical protein
MALDLARRSQLPLDAADAAAATRLPGDLNAGLELVRHGVLRNEAACLIRRMALGCRKVLTRTRTPDLELRVRGITTWEQ